MLDMFCNIKFSLLDDERDIFKGNRNAQWIFIFGFFQKSGTASKMGVYRFSTSRYGLMKASLEK